MTYYVGAWKPSQENADLACALCERRFSEVRALTVHACETQAKDAKEKKKKKVEAPVDVEPLEDEPEPAMGYVGTEEVVISSSSEVAKASHAPLEYLVVAEVPAAPPDAKASTAKGPGGGHTCSVCDKSYSRAQSLLQHQMTHREEGQRAHKCQDCGKGFAWKTTLGRLGLKTNGGLQRLTDFYKKIVRY